jgi:hypothetical protein
MLSQLFYILAGPCQKPSGRFRVWGLAMKASLKLLASVVLFLGLASTAFTHNTIDIREMDGALMARSKGVVLPDTLVFSGDFAGPVSWTLTSLSNGTHTYALTGVLTGAMGGAAISAITIERTANLEQASERSTAISGGDTTREESVPEPSTYALLATGTIALLGAIRRKKMTGN